jgi:hypothetical protein
MGALFLDVVGPIYKEHPRLIPPEMKKSNSSAREPKGAPKAKGGGRCGNL